MLRIISVGLTLLFILSSCGGVPADPSNQAIIASPVSPVDSGAILFRSDGEFIIQRQKGGSPVVFDVEIPRTPQEMIQGLKGRISLSGEQGMLFVYQNPVQVNFWMKDIGFPLDILFFDNNGKLVQIYEHTIPYSIDYFSSYLPVRYVLEIPAGTARKHSISLGDTGKELLSIGANLPSTPR